MVCRKRFVLVSLVVALFLSGCGALNSGVFSTNDFRCASWNDPMYLVQKNEGAMSTYENDSRLMYWDTFLGYDSDITYIFYDKKLTAGYINITDEEDKDAVFKDITSQLSDIYGKPVTKTSASVAFENNGELVYVSKDGKTCTVLFQE